MRTEQRRWSLESGWSTVSSGPAVNGSAQILFLFGGVEQVRQSNAFELAKELYPKAHVVGCTTAGEILGCSVAQDSVTMTAASFDHSRVDTARVSVASPEKSRQAGEELVAALPSDSLTHVLLFSDGLKVLGSDFVRGATAALPAGVAATGGFAGDGDRLAQTHIWCNSEPEQCAAVAVGFYGDRLKVTSAVTGPWGPFGPDRLVTRSRGNVLYEIDGRRALDMYKTYLGEYAAGLPATGLLFPLLMHAPGSDHCVLRALLAVDDGEGSITFAGNIDQGSYVRLMRGTIEHLIGDTLKTASGVQETLGTQSASLSLVISCNGRRHVLGQRIEEEVEAVDEMLGGSVALTGFYSYGEIGPAHGGGPVELHNETLTITSFMEQ